MFGWLGGALLMTGCTSVPSDTTLDTASEGDPSSSADPGATTAPDVTTGPEESTTTGSPVDPWTGSTSDDSSTTADPSTSSSTTGDASTGTGEAATSSSTTDESSTGGSTTDASTTDELAVCGDGQVGGAEACDDGAVSAQCDADCTAAECGDGVFNDLAGEVCDDGNSIGGDACSPTCLVNPKVKQAALGTGHTCVVLEDGAMRCWGHGQLGQLGYGNQDNLGDQPGELPTPDVLVGAPVIRACASGQHTCAVLEGGSVRCWGSNSSGLLGLGFAGGFVGIGPNDLPPLDTPVGAPAKDITCGPLHTCVLTQDDHVRCWGNNTYGQLGYGDVDDRGDEPGELPVPDVALGGPVAQVAAGDSHTCAVLQDGTLRCWGTNFYGELGYGDEEHRGDQPGEMPPPPVEIGGPAAQVAISMNFPNTCVLLTNGEARCWGMNMNDILGQPFPGEPHVGDEPGEMPTPALALAGKAVAVSVGAASACVLLESGSLQCWGSNGHGAVGTPGAGQAQVPTLIDIGGLAVHVASGNSHRCAVLTDGTLRCWGGAVFGRLGHGDEEVIGDDETPASAGPVPY